MGLRLDNLESSWSFHCESSYKYLKPRTHSSSEEYLWISILKFHGSVEPRVTQPSEVELVPSSLCLVWCGHYNKPEIQIPVFSHFSSVQSHQPWRQTILCLVILRRHEKKILHMSTVYLNELKCLHLALSFEFYLNILKFKGMSWKFPILITQGCKSVLQFVTVQNYLMMMKWKLQFQGKLFDLNFLSVFLKSCLSFHCRGPSMPSELTFPMFTPNFSKSDRWLSLPVDVCELPGNVSVLLNILSWLVQVSCMPWGPHDRWPYSVQLITQQKKVTDSGGPVRSGLAKFHTSCFVNQAILSHGKSIGLEQTDVHSVFGFTVCQVSTLNRVLHPGSFVSIYKIGAVLRICQCCCQEQSM